MLRPETRMMRGTFLCLLVFLVLESSVGAVNKHDVVAGKRIRGAKRRRQQVINYEPPPSGKMGMSGSTLMNDHNFLDMEVPVEASEVTDAEGSGKSKKYYDDDDYDDDDDDNPFDDDDGNQVILNAEETPEPTEEPTVDDDEEETDEPTVAPTFEGTKEPTLAAEQAEESTPLLTTEAPIQNATTEQPTVVPTTLAPSWLPTSVLITGTPTVEATLSAVPETSSPTLRAILTASPTEQASTSYMESALGMASPSQPPQMMEEETGGAPVAVVPTHNNTIAMSNIGDSDDGSSTADDVEEPQFFDGEDYYHRHLVPFAVSLEGDEATNDLGITSCLLTEMQKNMSNLMNLEMDNFTIVYFDVDEDGDGYKRYDLYFAGFGELIGLPVYPEAFFQDVQIRILGTADNDVEFYQSCLDNRFADSGKSYTASFLEHDQVSSSSGNSDIVAVAVQAEGDDGATEEDTKLRTGLIIGLTIAAVVVALGGIIFASRIMKGERLPVATLK